MRLRKKTFENTQNSEEKKEKTGPNGGYTLCLKKLHRWSPIYFVLHVCK